MLPTITAKRIAALAFVGRHQDNSITMRVLSSALGRKEHLVVKTVRELEMSDLVKTFRDDFDVRCVGVTKKGREVCDSMTPWAISKDRSVRGMGAILRGEA